MPSLRARFFNHILPLFGLKKFFSEPEKLEARIAKMRRRPIARPKAKWYRRLDISEDTSRGYPVITMAPKAGAKEGAPHLLYFHGGAYVLDAASAHYDAVAQLCELVGASVSIPHYPLAPEVTVDVTLPAMRKLYDELVKEHGATNLCVAGDSAGGGLALALVQSLRGDGGVMPASLVLFSPWLDATVSDASQVGIEPKDNILAIAGIKLSGELYAGKNKPSDPRVSPLFGPLEQLPPIAVFAGTYDILLPDARRFAKALGAADPAKFLYREYDQMPHDWMLFPIPEGRRALQETAEFIDRHHGAPK